MVLIKMEFIKESYITYILCLRKHDFHCPRDIRRKIWERILYDLKTFAKISERICGNPSFISLMTYSGNLTCIICKEISMRIAGYKHDWDYVSFCDKCNIVFELSAEHDNSEWLDNFESEDISGFFSHVKALIPNEQCEIKSIFDIQTPVFRNYDTARHFVKNSKMKEKFKWFSLCNLLGNNEILPMITE